jgi:hypothetical protein
MLKCVCLRKKVSVPFTPWELWRILIDILITKWPWGPFCHWLIILYWILPTLAKSQLKRPTGYQIVSQRSAWLLCWKMWGSWQWPTSASRHGRIPRFQDVGTFWWPSVHTQLGLVTLISLDATICLIFLEYDWSINLANSNRWRTQKMEHQSPNWPTTKGGGCCKDCTFGAVLTAV